MFTAGAPPASPAASAPADDATTADDGDDETADDSDDTAAAGAKVSANTASEDEISDTLEQGAWRNPGRWAEEVVEYRPYPTDDMNLTEICATTSRSTTRGRRRRTRSWRP